MQAIALAVGLVVAAPVAETANTKVATTVTVQFESGPVIVSHGVRPYLASGFRVADRSEQPLMQLRKPKSKRPFQLKETPAPNKVHPKPTIKSRGGKWIRFQSDDENDRQ